MPSTTIAPATGPRRTLGEYELSDGTRRQLIGQRVDGVVRLSDVPTASGRAYLVERELEHDGYAPMLALVADYIAQSERRDEPAIIVRIGTD